MGVSVSPETPQYPEHLIVGISPQREELGFGCVGTQGEEPGWGQNRCSREM